MARWRELSFDENPSGIDRDEWELGARSGPALGAALDYALAPRWNLVF